MKKNLRNIEIEWLGQAGFILKYKDTLICIDPYLTDSLCNKGFKRMFPPPLLPEDLNVNFILCTHNHGDHFDPETLKRCITEYPDTKVYGPASVSKYGKVLDIRIYELKSENYYDLKDFVLKPKKAFHSDPDALGLVLRTETAKIYITGDTLYRKELFENIKEELPIDILIVCINGKLGNMNYREAILLTQSIKPTTAVIPMHYGMFANNTLDPAGFIYEVKNLGFTIETFELGAKCFDLK